MDKLLIFFLIILFSVSITAKSIFGTGDDDQTIEGQTNQMNQNTITILKDANEVFSDNE